MSSEDSRTTSATSSRLSQFGIYRNIDARTEEFLRLSRKRQIRQGCACAAVSTAITVTVVVTVLLVYEYTTSLNSKDSDRQSNWQGFLNKNVSFDSKFNKANFNINPMTLKLLPLVLKALNHNRFLEKVMKETKAQNLETSNKEGLDITEHIFKTSILPYFKVRPNLFRDVKDTVLNSRKRLDQVEGFRKLQNMKEYQRVLNYFDKMVNGNTHTESSRDSENTAQFESKLSFPYYKGHQYNNTRTTSDSSEMIKALYKNMNRSNKVQAKEPAGILQSHENKTETKFTSEPYMSSSDKVLTGVIKNIDITKYTSDKKEPIKLNKKSTKANQLLDMEIPNLSHKIYEHNRNSPEKNNASTSPSRSPESISDSKNYSSMVKFEYIDKLKLLSDISKNKSTETSSSSESKELLHETTYNPEPPLKNTNKTKTPQTTIINRFTTGIRNFNQSFESVKTKVKTLNQKLSTFKKLQTIHVPQVNNSNPKNLNSESIVSYNVTSTSSKCTTFNKSANEVTFNPNTSVDAKENKTSITLKCADSAVCNCNYSNNLVNILNKLFGSMQELISKVSSYNNSCVSQNNGYFSTTKSPRSVIGTELKYKKKTSNSTKSVTNKSIDSGSKIKTFPNSVKSSKTTTRSTVEKWILHNSLIYETTTIKSYVNPTYISKNENNYISEPLHDSDQDKNISFDKLLADDSPNHDNKRKISSANKDHKEALRRIVNNEAKRVGFNIYDSGLFRSNPNLLNKLKPHLNSINEATLKKEQIRHKVPLTSINNDTTMQTNSTYKTTNIRYNKTLNFDLYKAKSSETYKSLNGSKYQSRNSSNNDSFRNKIIKTLPKLGTKQLKSKKDNNTYGTKSNKDYISNFNYIIKNNNKSFSQYYADINNILLKPDQQNNSSVAQSLVKKVSLSSKETVRHHQTNNIANKKVHKIIDAMGTTRADNIYNENVYQLPEDIKVARSSVYNKKPNLNLTEIERVYSVKPRNEWPHTLRNSNLSKPAKLKEKEIIYETTPSEIDEITDKIFESLPTYFRRFDKYSKFPATSTTTTTPSPAIQLQKYVALEPLKDYDEFRFFNEKENLEEKDSSNDEEKGYKYPLKDKYSKINLIENESGQEPDTSKFIRSMIPVSRPTYLEIHRGDWKHDTNEFETFDNFETN